MDEAIELAKKLKKELDDLPLFKEYYRLKSLVDNSLEIKELKKEVVTSKNDKKKHDAALEKYNSHPLVSNFKEIEGQVKEYLFEISQIINKK